MPLIFLLGCDELTANEDVVDQRLVDPTPSAPDAGTVSDTDAQAAVVLIRDASASDSGTPISDASVQDVEREDAGLIRQTSFADAAARCDADESFCLGQCVRCPTVGNAVGFACEMRMCVASLCAAGYALSIEGGERTCILSSDEYRFSRRSKFGAASRADRELWHQLDGDRGCFDARRRCQRDRTQLVWRVYLDQRNNAAEAFAARLPTQAVAPPPKARSFGNSIAIDAQKLTLVIAGSDIYRSSTSTSLGTVYVYRRATTDALSPASPRKFARKRSA